jgi:hypothetical protein
MPGATASMQATSAPVSPPSPQWLGLQAFLSVQEVVPEPVYAALLHDQV